LAGNRLAEIGLRRKYVAAQTRLMKSNKEYLTNVCHVIPLRRLQNDCVPSHFTGKVLLAHYRLAVDGIYKCAINPDSTRSSIFAKNHSPRYLQPHLYAKIAHA